MTDIMDVSKFHPDGITIWVRDDVICGVDLNFIPPKPNDVLIENLLETFKIKNIIAFSEF